VARTLAVAATVAVLTSCINSETSSSSQSALAQIRARGELRVVTLNLPTSYYLGAHGTRGLEFDLARLFAQQLGVNLVMYPVANEQAMQIELENGRADIAAAQITDSQDWDRVGLAAQPYGNIPQLVVYRRDKVRPSAVSQFAAAKLAVRAGSPQERQLEVLKQAVPKMHWIETAPYWADPLEDVDAGDADYAITDAREFSFSRHLYPTVMVGFELPQQRPVQWIVRHGASDLLSQVNGFFAALSQSGKLAPLLQRSTGDSRSFVYEESREFQNMMTERLPRFRSWFEQASAESGLDWRLIAAVAYQESKWDPVALSEDGAQGVMMLMAETAAQLGVKDRTNPQQSIFAGARYLATVHDKIPERIPEPDRTWFTVAAYNAGFGHIEDARVLAASLGKNSDSWADVRGQLPLLQQERWYAKAKHGYARGWEPVQMVDRVQRFLTLLEWQPGEGLESQSTRVNQADNQPAKQDPLEPSKVRTSGAGTPGTTPKPAERG
jgi:membrane-bound lytic murein transglycosylase F